MKGTINLIGRWIFTQYRLKIRAAKLKPQISIKYNFVLLIKSQEKRHASRVLPSSSHTKSIKINIFKEFLNK